MSKNLGEENPRYYGTGYCGPVALNEKEHGVKFEDHPKRGTKADDSKPDLSLIPKDPLWELARVLMAGEKKYGRWNWQNGLETHRLTAAAMRHITQFNDGELLDEETQTSHLMNACANLFFAYWMIKNKPECDTIPKKK